MEQPCYVFDLDGTLADLSHRLHHILQQPKNWRAFFAECGDDKPIRHTCQLAVDLHRAGAAIVYVSGRSDEVRDQTTAWLTRHGLPSGPLFMRTQGDHRPDDTVKEELLAALRAEGFSPIMAFDDRSRVVQQWRRNGVPCAQVAEGDF